MRRIIVLILLVCGPAFAVPLPENGVLLSSGSSGAAGSEGTSIEVHLDGSVRRYRYQNGTIAGTTTSGHITARQAEAIFEQLAALKPIKERGFQGFSEELILLRGGKPIKQMEVDPSQARQVGTIMAPAWGCLPPAPPDPGRVPVRR